MKKIKITAICALALVAVMILSSCSFGGAKDYTDSFAKNDVYVGAPVLTSSYSIGALEDLSFNNNTDDLFYFSGTVGSDSSRYEKHVVYNMATDRVLYSGTESTTKNIDVSLYRVYNDVVVFVVREHTWSTDNNGNAKNGSDAYYSVLFDADGYEIARTNTAATAKIAGDTVYFNGACYRVHEGRLCYEFDFSALKYFPTGAEMYGDKYYDITEGYIAVYNDHFELVSKYYYPGYVEEARSVVLENGNILVQFMYEADAYGDDYDFILSGEETKYHIETKLVDAKKGTAKDVDTEYVVMYAVNADIYDEENDGFDRDAFPVMGYGIRIENKRISEKERNIRILNIKNNGTIEEFEMIEGDVLSNAIYIADGRWYVATRSRAFVMDSRGDIIFEVTNATRIGKFFVGDGKVFDCDGNQLYDYSVNNYTIYNSGNNPDGAIIFKNSDGDFLFYNGNGSPYLIADVSEGKSVVAVGSSYFIVRESGNNVKTMYKVYNVNGGFVAEFENNVTHITTTDDYAVFRTTDSEGDTVIYRFSK